MIVRQGIPPNVYSRGISTDSHSFKIRSAALIVTSPLAIEDDKLEISNLIREREISLRNRSKL